MCTNLCNGSSNSVHPDVESTRYHRSIWIESVSSLFQPRAERLLQSNTSLLASLCLVTHGSAGGVLTAIKRAHGHFLLFVFNLLQSLLMLLFARTFAMELMRQMLESLFLVH